MPLTIFRQVHHLAGSAPDTTPLELMLLPAAMRIDIAIFDNTALISFTSDGRFWTTEREFLPAVFASLDQQVRGIRIRNKVALSIARYDMTGFYSPVEVVGEPFVPVP